ncbi:hypothetical protein ACB092_06G030600 [Castanea dentata]
MYPGTDFLLKPVFVRGLSASLHLVLLLVMFISWLCKKFKVVNSEGPSQRLMETRCLYLKQTVICCLGVSLFSLVLCLLNYCWYRNGSSIEELVTLLDLALKTLAWGAVSVYLGTQLFNSGEPKYPCLLIVWWGLYLFTSCCGLVIDVLYRKHVNLPVHYFVSDVVSVVMGLFFCYVGLIGKNEGLGALKEPLLIGDSNASNEAESNKSKGGETVTPYSNAGFFSILTFSWIASLISLGNKKTLDLEDVPQLAPGDSVVGAFKNFRNKLEPECGTINGVTTTKIAKALISSAWKEILLTAFLEIMNIVASYVGPYLIYTFVQYLNGRRDFSQNEGYVLVSMFAAAKLVECLTQEHYCFRVQQIEIRIQSVLVTMIYNKVMTLSCQSKQVHTNGEIINLMAIDAQRIGNFSWSMHDTWTVLVQVAIASSILYKNLGLASIAVYVVGILALLANFPLGSLQKKFQGKIMESKDRRMKATSEILSNMRILKLQGWEMKFLSKIMELRKTEAGWLKKFLYTSAISSFVFSGASTFVLVVTFGACMLMGIPLESGRILSAIATFGVLQGSISNFPGTISMIVQTKVSLDRIASFLRLDDLQSDVIERLPRGSSDTTIEIIDGNFSWDLSSSNPTLKDINLEVKQGMRVAICGTIGSGKSSLLSCILGEVPKISGTVKLCGTKAYVAQSPWIQTGKIEENILFGKEMEREKYERVLEACSLKKDLEILSFGDQTVIGERGINLSGGQKQRVQIACALYQDADIYLFDDPFSAVDAHTGSHLFKECLLGLLSSKTVVYVTHQVEFLPAADLILVMKEGRITQAGKYNDILNSGTDFMELVGAHKKALLALDSTEAGLVSRSTSTSKEIGNVVVVQKQENEDTQNAKVDDKVLSKGQIVQEEEREKGKVGFSVYWKYITMVYGGTLVPFILLAQVLFQLLQIGSNYWIACATPVSQGMKPDVGSSTLMIVYVSLAIGSSFFILVRTMLVATAGFMAANQLFNKMHLCIFRSPMSFFDATLSGRILN